MRVSFFPDAFEEQPLSWEGSWEELAQQFREHNYTRSVKEECPAFSPAIYPEYEPSRTKASVIELSAFVIDADNLDEAGALALAETVEELGLCAALYTTWSHAAVAPARYKLRVVIPLSRPVAGAAWDDFWPRAASLFGGVCDPKCKGANAIYFAPYAPAGTEDKNFSMIFEGVPLDVDALCGTDAPSSLPLPLPEGTATLSRDAFERYAKTLARKKSDERRSELGEILLKVFRGEIFADVGERDDVLYKLSLTLAARFPDCTPESIGEMFRPSLALMQKFSSDCPTVEIAIYKIRRAQGEQRQEQAVEEDLKRSRIREAFKNGRDTPYTAEEIKSFGPIIAKRWVVQRGKAFYFFVAGEYVGPYTNDDMQSAAERELAPASSAGVQLYKVLKDGSIVPKGMQQLVSQYGTVAQKTVLDLRAQLSSYEEETRTIIEAPCPQRKIEPTFSDEIDQWLQLMAGDRYEDLKTWLAVVTYLKEPCVALFLTGPKGTGKSLLAHGTSRIWTKRRPTPLEEVFSDFNETLAQCPLCFADEQLPKDYRGLSKNAELRQHIQAITRPLKRKFQPNATIEGATRTIVAANNEDVLSTAENLSVFDIEAIIDRYFHVPTQLAAAEYLKDTDTSEWVSGDKIAAHVLWLVANHPWERKGRFLLRVEDESLHRSLVTRTGVRSAICQWLVGYLMSPGKFDTDARSHQLVRVDNQRLLVNAQGLLECWEHYVKNEKCPFTGHLSSDLIALCKNVPRVRLDNDEDKRVNYRVFNVDNLIAWAERNGFAEKEAILDALKKDTIVVKPKKPSTSKEAEVN